MKNANKTNKSNKRNRVKEKPSKKLQNDFKFHTDRDVSSQISYVLPKLSNTIDLNSEHIFTIYVIELPF